MTNSLFILFQFFFVFFFYLLLCSITARTTLHISSEWYGRGCRAAISLRTMRHFTILPTWKLLRVCPLNHVTRPSGFDWRMACGRGLGDVAIDRSASDQDGYRCSIARPERVVSISHPPPPPRIRQRFVRTPSRDLDASLQYSITCHT